MATIGWHVGPAGNPTGIGDYVRRLDAAAIPAFIMSADVTTGISDALTLIHAGSTVPHTLIFRVVKGGDEYYSLPNYNLSPYDAAVAYWRLIEPEIPPEIKADRQHVWIQLVNEPDKNRASWLGYFGLEVATIANQSGYKVSLFGWASGEPEPAHWETPGMLAYLDYCGDHHDAAAISVHEYSYEMTLTNAFPDLIGRFTNILNTCSAYNIPYPTIHVTEFGWTYNDLPDVTPAMNDLAWAYEVYKPYPQVSGLGIWYLGGGYGDIANKAQRLIAPVTDFMIANPPTLPPEPCRGRPREQYRRSYVLLSPGLDETWALQALKGSWPKRLTIGASADDAGLGDLDVRNVLAINPAGWSGDLRAFYEQYYPGINYIPIVTLSPFQMRQYLQSYNPTTAAAPTLPAFTATHWPTDYRVINQPFGVNACRYCEFGLEGHEGIDVQAPLGSNVYAIASGQVYLAVTNPGPDNYGLQVRIRHNNGFWSVYAHLQSINVTVGQNVQGGQLIAKADSTGNSSGSHLHLGLGHDEADPGERMHVGMGRYIDPWPYLQPLLIPTGNAGIGLHAPADPVFTQGDFAEFDALRPNWIKVLSSHSFADINRLAAAHPTASFVVRAFLSFWQNGQPRNIGPAQFVTDTINDTRRAVDAIAAAGHGQTVIIEIHNEPNLYQEGLGGAWTNGATFSSWFLDVLGRYRTLLPQVKYAFPGLSPGPTVANVRLDSVAFMNACLGAAASADHLGVHAYWNSTTAPLAMALAVVDGYIAQVPNKPILITEASNNQSGNAEVMATDYVTFWQELRKRPRVQGVMYFVCNASNPEFAPELWTPRQLGAKVRAKMP